MGIPIQQLSMWSNQGAKVTSDDTFTSLKTALTVQGSPVASKVLSGLIKVDLQGSYNHDTNIRGDSDVDVVVKYTNAFHSNKRVLPTDQFQIHEGCYGVTSYEWEELRQDVITALIDYYGSERVDLSGKKSLKVLPVPGRLRLDVVPAVCYRKYDYFYGSASDMHSRENGICFKDTASGEWIVNYPDQHYKNAKQKHQDTNYRYRSMVRIFKNMKSFLINKNRLTKEEAPSYFIQGMVYNIPRHLFVADLEAATLGVLRWLRTADLSTFESQNKQHKLLGNTSDCWNPDYAKKTVEQLCFLWDNWGRI